MQKHHELNFRSDMCFNQAKSLRTRGLYTGGASAQLDDFNMLYSAVPQLLNVNYAFLLVMSLMVALFLITQIKLMFLLNQV